MIGLGAGVLGGLVGVGLGLLLFVWLPVKLETRRLRRAFERADREGVVVVVGEPGYGKTYMFDREPVPGKHEGEIASWVADSIAAPALTPEMLRDTRDRIRGDE